jgi:hypothetical protein
VDGRQMNGRQVNGRQVSAIVSELNTNELNANKRKANERLRRKQRGYIFMPDLASFLQAWLQKLLPRSHHLFRLLLWAYLPPWKELKPHHGQAHRDIRTSGVQSFFPTQ